MKESLDGNYCNLSSRLKDSPEVDFLMMKLPAVLHTLFHSPPNPGLLNDFSCLYKRVIFFSKEIQVKGRKEHCLIPINQHLGDLLEQMQLGM